MTRRAPLQNRRGANPPGGGLAVLPTVRIEIRWGALLPAEPARVSTNSLAGVAPAMFRSGADRTADGPLRRWLSAGSTPATRTARASAIIAVDLVATIEPLPDPEHGGVRHDAVRFAAHIEGDDRREAVVEALTVTAASRRTHEHRQIEIPASAIPGAHAGPGDGSPLLRLILDAAGERVVMVRGHLPRVAGFPAGSLTPPSTELGPPAAG